MEGICKVAQVEFGKSINSVGRTFDARLGGEAKDRATSLNGGVKREGKSKVHPRLSFGADDRKLGLGTKAEQPPATKTERKWTWAQTLFRLKRKTDPTTQNGENTGSMGRK